MLSINQLKEIFDLSEQAIYLYLDDTGKVCNKRFATMQGYASPEEWVIVEDPLGAGVDKSGQAVVYSAYTRAMEKLSASKIEVKLKKKTGETFDTSIIMVPIAYQGHLFALHYIDQI